MNRKYLLSLLTLAGIFFAGNVNAVCPLCVVAVGAGLGLSEWLGIDDLISSMWIGAILISLVLWTIDWLKRKKWNFAYDKAAVFLVYYVFTFVPLYYAGFIGHPLHSFFGTDKIIFGSTIGTAVFLFATYLHGYLKNKNGGKSYFSYQKVVLPVGSLIILSLIFYLFII